MPDNPPIHFAPSPGYPKPQGGRGSGHGGSGGGSSGYSKPNQRGRGRAAGMNSDRSQQGDTRGGPDMRGYQNTHNQQPGISNSGAANNNYASNMYPPGGSAVNATGNYVGGNYNNHYRGRDSRSSWDGSSNSSKKGSGNYNQHSSPMASNTVSPYPQSSSTPSVPSAITNVPSASGPVYVAPQYYTTGQAAGYVNNGAKSEISTTPIISQISIQQQIPSSIATSASSTGTLPPSATTTAQASGQSSSVQIEKDQEPVPEASPIQSVPVVSATPHKTSPPASSASNATSVGNLQTGQPTTNPPNQPTVSAKPAAGSMLSVQTVVSSSAANVAQQQSAVIPTVAPSAVSQHSSNSPVGVSTSTGSQRPGRPVTDDSNSAGGYHGYNSGYHQNYHTKSSMDTKDGPQM